MFARARLSCQIRAAALLDRFCDGLRPSVSGHRSLHHLLFDCRNYTPCTVITLQKNPSAGWINFGFVSALQHSTVLSRLWPKRCMEKRGLRSRYLFVRAAPGSHFSMFALKGAFVRSIHAHPVSSRRVAPSWVFTPFYAYHLLYAFAPRHAGFTLCQVRTRVCGPLSFRPCRFALRPVFCHAWRHLVPLVPPCFYSLFIHRRRFVRLLLWVVFCLCCFQLGVLSLVMPGIFFLPLICGLYVLTPQRRSFAAD